MELLSKAWGTVFYTERRTVDPETEKNSFSLGTQKLVWLALEKLGGQNDIK